MWLAWPDCSNCPWHFKGLFSCIPETLGLSAFLPMEKNCPSCPGTNGQIWSFPPKFPTCKGSLPDKSCQDRQVWLALASGHCLLFAMIHWGSMLSFLQERIILLQALMAEIGILPSKFNVTEDCSQIKALRTDRCGFSWSLVAAAHLPLKLRLSAFLPVEKSCSSFPDLHGLNWDSTSKSPISNDCS